MSKKIARQAANPNSQTSGDSGHPKYREVYDTLLRSIRRGDFPAGGRLPTENDLMQRFNFSRITIVRALRDLQAIGVVTRRRGSGSFVTIPARTSLTGIGLIFPPLEPGSIFATVHQALQRESQSRNWQILFYEMPENASVDQAQAIVDDLWQGHVKGLFYLPLPIHMRSAQINELVAAECTKRKTALVLLDRDIHKLYDRSSFDLVGSDNELGGFLVGRHLLDRGCRRIVFFIDEREHPTAEARLLGVANALRSVPDAVLEVVSGDGDDRSKLRQLISGFNPDAIACVNDMTAAKVMRSLLAEGVRIPGRIKLTGFDDTATASLLSVPLTTVRQSPEAMAFHAAAMMQHRIDRPHIPATTLSIACSLVLRASTQS
jgi:GntR family transcriptional regulator of arabinose operon